MGYGGKLKEQQRAPELRAESWMLADVAAAAVDPTRRHNRHLFGCCHVKYASTSVHREILGLMHGLMQAGILPNTGNAVDIDPGII